MLRRFVIPKRLLPVNASMNITFNRYFSDNLKDNRIAKKNINDEIVLKSSFVLSDIATYGVVIHLFSSTYPFITMPLLLYGSIQTIPRCYEIYELIKIKNSNYNYTSLKLETMEDRGIFLYIESFSCGLMIYYSYLCVLGGSFPWMMVIPVVWSPRIYFGIRNRFRK